jgi:hypothetical protein
MTAGAARTRLIAMWLIVGLPLAWGVFTTLRSVMALFG